MSIRLSKAIRNLNIGLQTAVYFLEKKEELGTVQSDPNFKLNDMQYEALVEEFCGHKRQSLKTFCVYDGKIVKIEVGKYILVELTTGHRGIVPAKELLDGFDDLRCGQDIRVVLLSASDDYGRITLSVKQLYPNKKEKSENKSLCKTISNSDEREEAANHKSIELTITKIKYPGRVITSGFKEYKGGIVFLGGMMYNDYPLNVSMSSAISRQCLKEGITCRFNFVRSSPDKQYAILEFDLADNSSEISSNEDKRHAYERAREQDVYDVTVQSEHIGYVKISASDGYDSIDGYISNNEFYDGIPQGSFKARLLKKAVSEFYPSLFTTRNISEICYDKEDAILDTDTRFQQFFDGVEIEELRKEGNEQNVMFVKEMLDSYPTFCKDTMNEVRQYVIIAKCKNSSILSQWVYFRESNPQYNTSNHYFWLNSYVLSDSGKQRIIIWDEQECLLQFEVGEECFILVDFEHDRKNDQTRKIIEKQSKPIVRVKASMLEIMNIYDTAPHDYEVETVGLYLQRMCEFSRVLYEIKRKIGNNRQSAASNYKKLIRFLDYQIRKEECDCREIVFIAGENIAKQRTAAEDNHHKAMLLNLDILTSGRILENVEYESDGFYVEIRRRESKDTVLCTAVLSPNSDCTWLLRFNDNKIPLSDLKNGFYIGRKANVKHLKAQKEVLEKFVRNDSLDIYDELLYGKIESPDISKYENLHFYNSVFNNAPNDNRQPEAIRKALGNKRILLIQGPPGTGKTSVIVEIIRQLVNEGKHVLVCSQANAAVENIYARLKDATDSSIDEMRMWCLKRDEDEETWGKSFDVETYKVFLENNMRIVHLLSEGRLDDAKKLAHDFNYEKMPSFSQFHEKLLSYYNQLAIGEKDAYYDILSSIKDDDELINSRSDMRKYIESMDVVLGTCVKVGIHPDLKRMKGYFDTVIIDEAAKANLSESILPMTLGRRFVLVGDDNQLPPYVDRNEVNKYVNRSRAEQQPKISDVENADSKETVKDFVEALSMSLFEDFHNNIPTDNIVTLNYQHRMHPEIGNCISTLFYKGELKNGEGTSNNNLHLEDFPKHVTFIDTSDLTRRYEIESNKVYCNPKEAEIIVKDIVPSIINAMGKTEKEKFLGIISPYKGQVDLIKSKLPSEWRECVHTIDSIQGSEYDVVVYSFVRSFNANTNKNVGFVDDLRRLNVSLSRARKKLILIGDLSTLCNKKSHTHLLSGIDGVMNVFRKISKYRQVRTEKSLLDKFYRWIKAQEPYRTVLPSKNWKYGNIMEYGQFFTFVYEFNNSNIELTGLDTHQILKNANPNENLMVKYVGLDKNGKPKFEPYI